MLRACSFLQLRLNFKQPWCCPPSTSQVKLKGILKNPSADIFEVIVLQTPPACPPCSTPPALQARLAEAEADVGRISSNST
jgi:hypothetical protein